PPPQVGCNAASGVTRSGTVIALPSLAPRSRDRARFFPPTAREGAMRTWLSLAAAAAVMGAGGNKSPEGGNPGTSDSFKIAGPTLDLTTKIKQGDKEVVKLSIERGKDFKKDVKLAVKHPDKIKAELNKTEIKASEGTDFNVTVDVDKDAP